MFLIKSALQKLNVVDAVVAVLVVLIAVVAVRGLVNAPATVD